jgi:hypothetical protein
MIKIEGMINLEEGEYVRTKNGSIFKIISGTPDDYDIDVSYYDLGKIEDDIFDDLTTFNYNDNGNFIRDITKKHSHNIMDLIEVGDYVNGERVLNYDWGGVEIANFKFIHPEEFKSIITHEQFERMKYKIL